eukprot:scaffold134148_cov23-Tisochrysis_lutea.AAC.1
MTTHNKCNEHVQVGGFFFIHRDDLKRLSKPWLQITEEVRFDEEVGSSLVLLWDCASSVQLSRFLWWHGQVLAEFAAVHSITSALS